MSRCIICRGLNREPVKTKWRIMKNEISILRNFSNNRREKKRLVILGSGWASYALLRNVDKNLFDISVVSPRNYFLFTPLLASTTVGTLEFRSIIEPVRNIGFKNPEWFHLAHAVSIDKSRKTVRCESLLSKEVQYDIAYDYLAVGIGCLPSTFQVPGVMEHALFLKELEDAREIRRRIISNFELALEPGVSESESQRLLHTVIVGGGPTGVEFGAELHDFLVQDVSRLYSSEKPLVKVSLIESDKILSSFDSRLQNFAEKKIKNREHFELIKDQVVRVNPTNVVLKSDQTLDCGLVVWSTGLSPRKLTERMEWAKKSPSGFILTDNHFRVLTNDSSTKCEDIFAIGDCSTIEKEPLPSTAQVAERQGRHLARNLNSNNWKVFKFSSMGMLAYIGGYQGLSDLPDFKLRGFTSWFLWRSAYLTRLGSWRLRMQVPLDWTKTLLFGRDTSKF